MSDTVIDVPAPAPEIDDAIRDFRLQNSPVLMDRGHPDHKDAVGKLEGLYRQKFPTEGAEPIIAPKPIVRDEVLIDKSGERNPTPIKGEMADYADKMLTPASSPEDFALGKNTADHYPEFVQTDNGQEALVYNPDFEAWSQQVMFEGGLSPNDGRIVEHEYAESIKEGWTAERVAANEQATMTNLVKDYGVKHVDAIIAAKRVVDELGGSQLKNFLNQSGLGSNPRVVNMFVKRAISLGYFSKD